MNRIDDQLPPDGIEAAAASWLARRDRGFSGAEQDAYLQWLQESPSHGAAVARLEKTWGVLDQLSEWRPAHSAQPNPDLLAPHPRISRRLWFAAGVLATAAALALGLFVSQPEPAPASSAPVARLVQNSNLRKLPDGTVVEMNRGSNIDVVYRESERRVRLLHGEAHFTVTKDPARPFIVEAGGVAVRAIGTAFNVRLSGDSVEVLVTSGTVQVDSTSPPVVGAAAEPLAPKVGAGHRVVLPSEKPTQPVAVESVSQVEIERALAWQGLRLDFAEATLAQAVAEFNRHNQHQLVVSDPGLAGVRIGGNFRADNVDGFVRLMVTSLGVTAERTGDHQTTLRP
jgi:transmembrane sensor